MNTNEHESGADDGLGTLRVCMEIEVEGRRGPQPLIMKNGHTGWPVVARPGRGGDPEDGAPGVVLSEAQLASIYGAGPAVKGGGL